MAETRYAVRYVGPFTEGVEENNEVVKPGETIEVDGERAAHLTAGEGAWELVDKNKRPRAAPASEEIGVAVSPTDVHANAPAAPADDEPPPSGGKDEG